MLLYNVFNLYDYHIPPDSVYDTIDRAIGIYENNITKSVLRTCNPFFWLSFAIKYIISLPFKILGLLGFDQEKIELSFIGQFIKGILYIITVLAALLSILEKFDLLNTTKEFIRNIFK